jgi:YhcH/YjgK/YiaL family protein
MFNFYRRGEFPMITDKFKNIDLYCSLSDRFSKAIDFLRETDFTNLEPQKIIIDGENIFAILAEYQTKDIQNCKLEAHRKYIDIQYIISGSELIGYAPLNGQTIIEEYDGEKDVIFFDGETSLVKLDSGMFAVFFPDDLHKPCIQTAEISELVKKIVVKIKVN